MNDPELEGVIDEIENENTPIYNDVPIEETGNAVNESNEENEEQIEEYEQEMETVTDESTLGGDIEGYEEGMEQNQIIIPQELIDTIAENNLYLEELLEIQKTETMTIWEKPLEEYNVKESMQLIFLIIVIWVVVYKMIGGIISVWNL